MFASDRFIFIELHKTGTSTITGLFNSIQPGQTVRDRYGHKHNRLEEDPQGRMVIGSIRNPFDWYVSLWAYGCAGKGTLHWQLTAPFHRAAASLLKRSVLHPRQRLASLGLLRAGLEKDAGFWRRVYSDPNDPALFREWLCAIMSEAGKRQMTEGYSALPLRNVVGFYSYRFLYLFTDHKAWDKEAGILTTYPALRAFYDRANIVSAFIRTEHITDDFAALMHRLGEDSDSLNTTDKRTNQSSHKRPGDYYNEQTQELVYAQDRLIFDLFGYDARPTSGDADLSGKSNR